jgi:hypothetical protein
VPQSWGLLQVLHQQTTRFIDLVNERFPHPDVELFNPTHMRLSRPHGARRSRPVTVTAYPGYIFCKSDLQAGYARYLISLPIKSWWVRFNN